MNKKALSLAVFIAISYPGSSFALGLGEIESASHLNQPFKAKINLLSTSGSDVSQLKVKVASPSVFSRVGIDRPAYLNSLSFRSIVQNGKPVILVSSNQPIREPFINFLLEVSWPKGQLLKEYTVLLDPPVLLQPGTSIASNTVGVRPDPVRVTQQQSQAASQQAVRQQQQRQRVIAQQQATRQRQQQLQRQRQQQAQNTPSDGLRRPGPPLNEAAVPRSATNTGGTYRVSRGDTLYKIAQKIGYQGVRTEQMMMALFEANPTAFRKRNINHLKAGVTMRRPSINEAKRITQSQARRDIRNQTVEWKSQRKAVATAPKNTPTKNTPTKVAASNSADKTGQARIEVSGSTDGERSVDSDNLVGKAKIDALNRQMTLASESLTARTHENNELKSRVSELESLLRKKNKLITLKNEQLADLQVKLGGKPTAMMNDNDASDVADPIDEQATGIQQAIVEQESREGEIVRTQDPAEEIINDPIVSQEPIYQPPITEDEPTITSAITPPPTQPEEDNGILELLSSPLVMGLGGGSLLALIGGLLFLRRRNAKDEYDEYSPIDFDDPSLAPGSSGFDDVRAEPAQNIDASADPFASPEEAADQFVEDFQADPMEEFASTTDVAPAATIAPTAPIPNAPADVDAEEDDILQEADVYIVYGLHEQAEVELKKAIAKQPDNLEYRAKLLENYHASDNKEAFEAAAAEFAPMQGPGKDALWDKVSSWGRKMIPGSPVFAGPGVAEAIQNSTPDTSAVESDSGIGGLGLAAGAAALGGVAITAGKAIADNTQDGVEAISDAAESAVSDLTDDIPSLDDFTSEADDTKAEVLDFDDMDLDSLLSADSKDSELSLDMPDIETEELVEVTEDVAQESFNSDVEEMDFDFSDFELDDAAEEPASLEQVVANEADDLLDMSDFADLGLDLDENSEGLAEDLGKNDFDVTNLNLALDGSDTGVGKILPDNSVYKMSGDAADKAKDDILGEIDDDLSFLDLDTAVDDDMVDAQVSTKLDLARAYMDMGDVEGARTTLEEVIAEGDDNQRREAEELLEQTG